MMGFVVIAALAAAFFAMTTLVRKRASALLAAAIWAAYAVYEYYVASGVLCDANCNIRVDLVLFLPFLIWVTVLGLKEPARPSSMALFVAVLLVVVAVLLQAFGYRGPGMLAGVAAVAVGAWAVWVWFRAGKM